MTIIHKFGGTSLGNIHAIQNIIPILKKHIPQDQQVIVVSACNTQTKALGTTNTLIKITQKLTTSQDKAAQAFLEAELTNLKHSISALITAIIPDHKTAQRSTQKFHSKIHELQEQLSKYPKSAHSQYKYDKILSYGEYFSSIIIAEFLESHKIATEAINLNKINKPTAPPQENPFTSSPFSDAEKEVLRAKLQVLTQKSFQKGKIPIFTGFIGEIPHGILRSIGRGYTDYTSALIATSTGAEALNIWKETDGIHTTDPKIIAHAKPLKEISAEEAYEICAFGAEVINPKAIEECIQHKIPIRIKNTFRPENPGTVILHTPHRQKNPITNIILKRGIILINIYSSHMIGSHGFIRAVSRVFDEAKIPIDLISTSQANISLTLTKEDLEWSSWDSPTHPPQSTISPQNLPEDSHTKILHKIVKKLQDLSSKITINYDETAMISIIGQDLYKNKLIQSKIFKILADQDFKIEMISQAARQTSISCIINTSSPKKDYERAIRALHEHFFPAAGVFQKSTQNEHRNI